MHNNMEQRLTTLLHSGFGKWRICINNDGKDEFHGWAIGHCLEIAFRAKPINGKTNTICLVGVHPKELSEEEKRQILTAAKYPHSLVFDDVSRYTRFDQGLTNKTEGRQVNLTIDMPSEPFRKLLNPFEQLGDKAIMENILSAYDYQVSLKPLSDYKRSFIAKLDITEEPSWWRISGSKRRFSTLLCDQELVKPNQDNSVIWEVSTHKIETDELVHVYGQYRGRIADIALALQDLLSDDTMFHFTPVEIHTVPANFQQLNKKNIHIKIECLHRSAGGDGLAKHEGWHIAQKITESMADTNPGLECLSSTNGKFVIQPSRTREFQTVLDGMQSLFQTLTPAEQKIAIEHLH